MINWDDFSDDVITTDTLQKLPAMMSQIDGSFNQALLGLLNELYLKNIHDLQRIKDWQSIDQAPGKALDMLAKDWGTYRIDADDDFLRFLIRLARMRGTIGITEDDLINYISFALGASPSEIHIVTDPNQLDGDPQALKITGIPWNYANDTRRTDIFLKTIQMVVGTETRIFGIYFEDKSNSKTYVATFTQIAMHYELKEVR